MAVEREELPIEKMLLLGKINDFLDLVNGNRLVKAFSLSGPSDNVNICHTFIALKATPGTLDAELLVIPINQQNGPILSMEEVCRKIVESDIPKQIRDSNVRGHSEFAERTINAFGERGLPYIAFVIGHSERTKEEMITLLAVAGLTPTTALKELKGICQKIQPTSSI